MRLWENMRETGKGRKMTYSRMAFTEPPLRAAALRAAAGRLRRPGGASGATPFALAQSGKRADFWILTLCA